MTTYSGSKQKQSEQCRFSGAWMNQRRTSRSIQIQRKYQIYKKPCKRIEISGTMQSGIFDEINADQSEKYRFKENLLSIKKYSKQT